MKRSKKVIVAIAATLLILGGVAFGCFHLGRSQGAPARIIFIPKIIDNKNDFWVQLLEGARMAAMENGMEIEIVAPDTEDDVERQNRLVDWAIEQKPEAIVLVPSSYVESAAAVRRIEESGIPLILVDSEAEGHNARTVVCTDNVNAGRIQGEFMRSYLKEGAEIALICHVQGSSTAQDREKGVREGLGDYEDQIVDVVFCDSNYDKAYRLMNEVLDRHPNIKMVAGLNEYSAVGAARAIKDRKLQDQIDMVGFDCSLEEIQLLEEGVFEGIVIQNPYKMGYLSVEAAASVIRGEPVPEKIDSDSKLVTREEIFTDENQKILFMFTEE